MSLLFQPWTWSSRSTGLQLCPGKVRRLKWMGKRAFKLFGISTYFLSRFLRWRSHLLAECRKLKIEFSCQVFQRNWALISWLLVWQEWLNGQKQNKTTSPKQKNAHAHKINSIRGDPCKNQKCPTGTLSNLKSVINFTLPGKHLVVIKLSEMTWMWLIDLVIKTDFRTITWGTPWGLRPWGSDSNWVLEACSPALKAIHHNVCRSQVALIGASHTV